MGNVPIYFLQVQSQVICKLQKVNNPNFIVVILHFDLPLKNKGCLFTFLSNFTLKLC